MKKTLLIFLCFSLIASCVFAFVGTSAHFRNQDSAYSDSFSAEIYELKSSMSDLYIDKEAHEQDLKEIEEKIDYWIFEQEMVKNEQTGHQNELENIELFLEDLQLRIEETADNQQLLLQKAEYEEDKAEIEEKLADCEARLSAISVELSTLETKVSTIEEQLSAVNEEIDSLQSQIDDLYARVNALNRNIFTAFLKTGTGYFTAKQYTVIKLSTYASVGSKLTLNSSGGIVIGAGVSKVLVSYSAQYKQVTGFAGQRFVSCFRNETQKVQAISYSPEAEGQTDSISAAPCMFSVSQGDVITIQFYTYSAKDLLVENSSTCRTYLTVEVVE